MAWGNNFSPTTGRERTVPAWMDLEGTEGPLFYLVLEPAELGKSLPNTFVVAKSIEQLVGKITDATRVAKTGCYILQLRDEKKIRKLLTLNKLIDDTPVTIKYHPSLNFTRCVVRCPDVNCVDDSVLLTELESQGVIKIHRFSRIVNTKPELTGTMCLTLKTPDLPKYIYFGLIRVPTRLYVPRPMQCFNCAQFGHTKNKCENQAICLNCGQMNHGECQVQAKCINCSDSHQANNKSCSKYILENEVIKMKYERNISFAEARKIIAKSVPNSSTVQNRLNAAQRPDPKDKIIADLTKLLEETKNELYQLKQELLKTKKTKNQRKNKTERDMETDEDSCQSSENTSVANKFGQQKRKTSPPSTRPSSPKRTPSETPIENNSNTSNYIARYVFDNINNEPQQPTITFATPLNISQQTNQMPTFSAPKTKSKSPSKSKSNKK